MTSQRVTAVASPRNETFSNGSQNRTICPRLDQLVVYTAILKHLLQQKIHYDNEGNVEIQRLERFKSEGIKQCRLRAQEQVVKKVQSMLPRIVYKMRNDVERLRRFLHTEKVQLKELNGYLYEQSWQLLNLCKENLELTT
ncbi:tubulin-specific chaperone A [Drosophila tropicalis]|uniref:tubulin-specific chaperone A n=1 Tax=Drosophila tropicalis TaxID=46794 RepID=UPI0035AC1935